MKGIQEWLVKAQHSKKAVHIVSFMFWRLVPFNRPHGIVVESVEANAVQVQLPYRKRNLNHLKSIHACALATAAEFSAGILLLKSVDPERFRLIMKRISIEYVAQARKTVLARAELSDEIQQALSKELPEQGIVEVEMPVVVHDVSGKEICVASVLWQLKDWSTVRGSES